MKSFSRFLALCLPLLLAARATTGGSGAPPKPNADVQAVTTYHIGVDD